MFEPTTRKTTFTLRPDTRPLDNGAWVWPLPKLGGRSPRVIANTNDDRCGLDLGYEDDNFGGPLFVPVYAAQGGTISHATKTSTGYSISLDHGGKWSTHYAHLEHMFARATDGRRRRPEQVRAGDVLGYAARSPTRVRFELWQWTDDDGYLPVPAQPRMSDWLVLPQFDDPRTPIESTTNQAAA